MSADSIDQAKRALRADLRERRQIMSDAARRRAADGLRTQLDALVTALGARSLSCYLPTPTEPDTAEFVVGAVERGIRVLLPISRTDGLLDWAVASGDGGVREGLFGLPEPTGDVLGPIAVNDVDLMLVPAAAIDRGGMRLGWGRGYFDKTIGSMLRCPPIYAVVFDHEVVDGVPADVHDQPVSGVVTPTHTFTFTPADR